MTKKLLIIFLSLGIISINPNSFLISFNEKFKTNLDISNFSLLPYAKAENGSFYFNLANKSLGKRDYKKAIEYGEKALNYYINNKIINKEYFLIHTTIGVAKLESGDNVGAIEILSRGIGISKDTYGFNLRGRAKLAIKDFEGAINDFTEAINYSAKDDKKNLLDLYPRRAWAYLLNGDFEKSIADYSNAISITPQTNYYLLRGFSRYQLGDYKGNCEDILNAEKIKNEYAYTEKLNIDFRKLKEDGKCALY